MQSEGERQPHRGRVALAVALAMQCAGAVGSAAPANVPAPATRPLAPDFSREDLSHGMVSLSALHGKVVLLNFWATWCTPCLAEMPKFAQWQQRYGGLGLQVVGISMDDEAAPVMATYGKYHLDYPVVMGDAALGEQYGGVYGLPVTFLIDRNGHISARHQGAADLDQLEGEIRALLDAP